jgi:hypothetical protein
MEATLVVIDVFLKGTWVEIHDDVHRGPFPKPEVVRRPGAQRTDDGPRRHQVGKLGPTEPGDGEQPVVVVHPVDPSIVGDPVGGDRVEGGTGTAGELEIQIVDRL